MPSPLCKTRTPSIREIARAAGVSASTVSRALGSARDSTEISDATRDKIITICKRLKYQPNVHATRLFSRRSNAIAFAAPVGNPDGLNYTDPNLAKTLTGLTNAASRHGQQLVLLEINDEFIESKQYLQVLRNRSVDGMIIWGALEKDREFVSEITREHWPVILANGSLDRLDGTISILVDNRAGGALMARKLIELGHRHICFLKGSFTFRAAEERQRGFEEVCRAAGASMDVRATGDRISDFFEAAARTTREILSSPSHPTAIAAMSDLLGLGAIEGARQLGLRVPEDVSITGGDDAFPLNRPRLTTFRAPMEEIGRQSLVTLLSRIESAKKRAAAGDALLPVTFVEGQTLSACHAPRVGGG